MQKRTFVRTSAESSMAVALSRRVVVALHAAMPVMRPQLKLSEEA